MGTRNLTIIRSQDRTCVAQYGQWDGQLSGVGQNILDKLRELSHEAIREAAERVTEITQEQINYVNSFNKTIKVTEVYGDRSFDIEEPEWKIKFPWLSRDCAGDRLLQYLVNGEVEFLTLQEIFAADSLFCEWCYVIDFDQRTFEVYGGFNHEPLEENERFFYLKDKTRGDYQPVKHLATFSLDNLPTDETFLNCGSSESVLSG